MHELGVLVEVVKTVEKFAENNETGRIETLVLQVGELSSMIPEYLKKLYPAAVDGTILEGSALEIEIIPANALCRDCKKVFGLVKSKGKCPFCDTVNWEMLSGREFFIKEIVVEQE